MKLQPQIDLLYKKLDAELDNFNKGERFLSLNQIMKKYHANLRVINGALEQLENNGLIVRKRYIGIFCNVNRNKKIPTLLLAVPDYPSEELYGFVRILEKYLEENPVVRLNIHRYQENERCSVIPLGRTDAVLFFGDSFPFSTGELKKLSDSGTPIIFTTDEFDSPFSYINFDSVGGGMIACDYLLKQGCVKLLAIRTEPLCRGIKERLTAFESYAALHNASCKKLECNTQFFESSSYNAKEMMSYWLAQTDFDFDGIFVDCYTSAESILNALRETCPEKAASVKIVTFCGYGRLEPKLLDKVTMIGCSHTEFANSFFRELVRLCKKEIPSFSCHLPMTIRNKA